MGFVGDRDVIRVDEEEGAVGCGGEGDEVGGVALAERGVVDEGGGERESA